MKNDDKTDPNLNYIKIGANEDFDSPSYDQDASKANADLAREKDKAEIQKIVDEMLRDSNIHKWRKRGLVALFSLIVVWLIVIVYFVYMSGHDPNGFPKMKISDQVLMTLIGTTTVNVVLLFQVAIRWLYGNSKQSKKD